MSNLIVSSSVDTFMQAESQSEMQAAIGTFPHTLAASETVLQNTGGAELLGGDAHGNPMLGSATGNGTFGFVSNGYPTIYAYGDMSPLPAARKKAFVTQPVNFSLSPGSSTTITIPVAGTLIGDCVSVYTDSSLPQTSSGGQVIAGIVVSTGAVTVTVLNTDPNNYSAFSGNLYVVVIG